MSTLSPPSFTPLEGIAPWTKSFFLGSLALALVGIVSGVLQIELLSRVADGGISEAEAAANDSRQAIVGLLQSLVFLGTVLSFLVWFHRAHQNLRALGCRDLKYTPGWAVGGFFVPILNLIRPFQVMREVWHGSDPHGLERDSNPSSLHLAYRLGTPALIGWWWGLFLASGFVGNSILRMTFSEDPSLEELQTLSGLLVFSDALEVPAAVLAFGLVSRITTWQGDRIARIRSTGLGMT